MDRRYVGSDFWPNEGLEHTRARIPSQGVDSVRQGPKPRLSRSLIPRIAKLEQHILGSRLPDPRVLMLAEDWQPESVSHACVRCGVTVSKYECGVGDCGECRRRASRLHATVRLGRYAPPLSQWVPAVKSRCWVAMAHVLGEALAFQVLAAVDENRLPMPDAIIPMPVHWSRAWMRGIDHTRELADALGASLNRPVKRHLRVRLAVRQAGTTRTQRLANRGRYEFRYPSRWAHPAAALLRLVLRSQAGSHTSGGGHGLVPLANAHVLLVDDVRTTGTSSEEAADCLLKQGAKSVSLAVCAVSDPPRRSGLRRKDPEK